MAAAPRPASKLPRPERRQRARPLRERGLALEQIAAQLGASPSTISTDLRLGVPVGRLAGCVAREPCDHVLVAEPLAVRVAQRAERLGRERTSSARALEDHDDAVVADGA